MKINKIVILEIVVSVILLTLILKSCSKNSPIEIWGEFKTDLIDKKTVAANLFSGRREIDWISSNGKLKKQDFFKYANENYWILIDSIEVNNRQIPKEELKKLEKIAIEIIGNKVIPNLATNRANLYIFEINNVSNKTENKKNGFLIIENFNQNFKIVQIWGN